VSKRTTRPQHGETHSLAGAEVCIEAYDLITGDRNNDYDHPLEDYTKVAMIFQSLSGVSLTVEQAVLFPLAMKLARMRTASENNRWHHDSVVDAIGYLGCLSMINERKKAVE
jgi:hypothetical protein